MRIVLLGEYLRHMDRIVVSMRERSVCPRIFPGKAHILKTKRYGVSGSSTLSHRVVVEPRPDFRQIEFPNENRQIMMELQPLQH
jgi:hypothetical protein